LIAALLSSVYYLMKLRQECGDLAILSCAARQVIGPSRTVTADHSEVATVEARKAAEQFRREREESERRIRAAEEARRAAEEKRAAEEARKLAEQRERAAEEARKAAERHATALTVDGMWHGEYWGGLNARPVNFSLSVRLYGSDCRGRTEEPNTFGHRSAPKLYANIVCRLGGGGRRRLVFTKTYDGTGGQSHSVEYEGEISLDGRRIMGTWRIGTLSGPFSLTRE
jgi:hypothetical protein